MLELGVLLLVIGVVLLLAPVPFPNKDAVGWLIAFIGLVLIVLAVVDINCSGSHCVLAPAALWPRWRRQRMR